ncbi:MULTISPECIES: phosphate ABC transporter substrate-binding protein PstS [Acidiphilium]|uniref:Phosphate-binding protein PstS n=1 Tax=Acidiphilium rubrum TaxID=526 RepID=A0A8G2CJE0_ACIRU|nr:MULTISPECIES: phosphate ABC transporter substrate-binding protein PstS [Acidiphilium]SIQ49665.1 phosphate ABC transporter substrate-binding protein, PhoT family [Acidiphilium rubrum]
MRSDSKLRRSTLLRAAAAAALVAGLGMGVAQAAGVSLVETGSSLLYPLFNIWVPHFEKAHPGVKVTTQSTGSGAGIAQAISGVVQVGASDAYMSDQQIKQNPDILNIPLAISAQAINYNLPGLNNKHIKFSGPVLAGIYTGKITKWNDPAIEKLNPGLKLPDHQIIPVHRTDGSGDTFIFSQYLDFSTPSWASTVGYGTTVSWPAVQGGLGANGNPGMVEALKQNPYAIAYIGVSFYKEVAEAHLGKAMLLNKAGKFVLPTAKTISAAADQLVGKTPADERISLVFAPGAMSYPIINYEYAIVNSKQKDAATAKAVKDLLTWASNEGNNESYLKQVEFKALPPAVKKLSAAQIAKIGS